MFLQTFYQAECSGSWVIVSTNVLPYLAMIKNPKIRSCDLDLWPWGFVRLSRYMFVQSHRVQCSDSCAQRKKTPRKTIQSVATARTVNTNKCKAWTEMAQQHSCSSLCIAHNGADSRDRENSSNCMTSKDYIFVSCKYLSINQSKHSIKTHLYSAVVSQTNQRRATRAFSWCKLGYRIALSVMCHEWYHSTICHGCMGDKQAKPLTAVIPRHPKRSQSYDARTLLKRYVHC